MPNARIYCGDLRLGPGAQFALAPDAANHVGKALRLKVGDTITVFDGRGGEYDAVILRIDRDRVDVKTGAFRDVEREARVAVGLVQGLPEADKMDWIIQKSVELGVSWIQPIVCDRSVVRLSGERATRREQHWQRVAIAACEQCGRNRIAEVRPTLGYLNWIAQPSTLKRWLLSPEAPLVSAQPAPEGELELLVGPEGGFSERELDLAGSRGFLGVGLGPRILRTETAPLAALATIQALWGDFSR
ncbi:16S rRNA (uracil(1498)-N(3))-methyltransferase [Usitatibacter palustris]|uniref:Ribosomal RNA small subunit methyltransferase E n=1 Tax=Usitatibacter palustris TaxID=2732487 RepID=A0A6M4HEK1_9PROT|nr:16S rRNA (uracil(1498)-N(3))-methyltransferase [Usitatibacter palustris]QJR16427.1 Ribosomal RNA small subunit methyltransferase E [Usitatibacter palustris]